MTAPPVDHPSRRDLLNELQQLQEALDDERRMNYSHEAARLVTENRQLREERDNAIGHLRSIVNHWNEFGWEYGIEESIDGADRWLKRLNLPESYRRLDAATGVFNAVIAGVGVWVIMYIVWRLVT